MIKINYNCCLFFTGNHGKCDRSEHALLPRSLLHPGADRWGIQGVREGGRGVEVTDTEGLSLKPKPSPWTPL